MKHFFKLIVVLLIVAVVISIRTDAIKKERYRKAKDTSLSHEESAEAMRKLGHYELAEGYAAFYQALAEHDFAAAAEAYAQYDLQREDVLENKVFTEIERECDTPDALLSACMEAKLPFPKATANTVDWLWELDDSQILNHEIIFSLLGFENNDALLDACGLSPDGKLLILYSQTGVDPLYNAQPDFGANLSAMASQGEALWPTRLSDVEYVLRVEYDLPKYNSTERGNTTLNYRAAKVNLTLTRLPDNDVLYQSARTGKIPESIWVGRGVNAKETYFPDLHTVLDEALTLVGGKIGTSD